MSGIAGVITADGSEPPSVLLRKLCTQLHSRGSDDSGIMQSKGFGFIAQKLNIDKHDEITQPITNSSAITMVFDCCLTGHYLQTDENKLTPHKSDANVILQLYNKYGIDFTKHLHGMYALALYNQNTNELILSRDVFGTKPMYYMYDKKYFIFASELKTLANLEHVTQEINQLAQQEFINYGTALNGKTIMNSIHMLLPGETLLIKKGIIKSTLQNLAIADYSDDKANMTEKKQQVTSLIFDSLHTLDELEQKSACFLDTSSDYLLAKAIDNTFGESTVFYTITVDKQPQDIKNIFDMHNTHEIYFTENDLWSNLPYISSVVDKPCHNPNLIFTYKMIQEVDSNCKILFSGLGGNILFADWPPAKKANSFSLFSNNLYPTLDTKQMGNDSSDHQNWQNSINLIAKKNPTTK